MAAINGSNGITFIRQRSWLTAMKFTVLSSDVIADVINRFQMHITKWCFKNAVGDLAVEVVTERREFERTRHAMTAFTCERN